MSVYVDPEMPCQPTRNWPWLYGTHLFADSVEELHRFAAGLGLKRSWFQGSRRTDGRWRLPHYDLTPGKRQQALGAGAISLTRADAVAKWKEIERKETCDSTPSLL